MKTAFLILPLLALLGVALCWAIYAWNSIERPWLHSHDPRHLFLARNWLRSYGLMFYSSRHGYDDIDRRDL
jgi:4-amino-4-deoxy-L-arabinose transferase-like glycosyltransferase